MDHKKPVGKLQVVAEMEKSVAPIKISKPIKDVLLIGQALEWKNYLIPVVVDSNSEMSLVGGTIRISPSTNGMLMSEIGGLETIYGVGNNGWVFAASHLLMNRSIIPPMSHEGFLRNYGDNKPAKRKLRHLSKQN